MKFIGLFDMNKYKDFQDLEEINEESLTYLFNKRNYGRHIDNPLADDLIIADVSYISEWKGDFPVRKLIDYNPSRKTSTFAERMELKNKGYSVSYIFPNTNDLEYAKNELKHLKPDEIEDRYLRKRVESYLEICKKMLIAEVKKSKLSMRRVYSFMITEALNRGESRIRSMGKKEFMNYISLEKNFKDSSPNTIYITVKSTYKGEKNYIIYFDEMKKKFRSEYDYAMKTFMDYYPNLKMTEIKK
jgi:hypothetical protein